MELKIPTRTYYPVDVGKNGKSILVDDYPINTISENGDSMAEEISPPLSTAPTTRAWRVGDQFLEQIKVGSIQHLCSDFCDVIESVVEKYIFAINKLLKIYEKTRRVSGKMLKIALLAEGELEGLHAAGYWLDRTKKTSNVDTSISFEHDRVYDMLKPILERGCYITSVMFDKLANI